jgi:hypothetical protein
MTKLIRAIVRKGVFVGILFAVSGMLGFATVYGQLAVDKLIALR